MIPQVSVVRGVSHVSLSVRDLDRSFAFYTEVLDLPVLTAPFDGVAFDGREALVLAGRVAICLQQHDSNQGEESDPRRTGLDHLALHLSSVEDLRSWRQRLAARGVEASEVRKVMFGWIVELRDPDGIQLELFAPE
jgi:glyoxylase I family protein